MSGKMRIAIMKTSLVKQKRQNGVALLVAMVALLILTVIGMVTMGDLLIQSGTIRNEQFKQRVFYAASSELNAIIKTVNQNPSVDDDWLIDSLLANQQGSNLYQDSPAPIATHPPTVQVDNAVITASRNDLLGCVGESIGRVKVLAGSIDASARLDDLKRNQGIRSNQRQRFVYCWP
jgi:Tfp pilus assembly protein PilV